MEAGAVSASPQESKTSNAKIGGIDAILLSSSITPGSGALCTDPNGLCFGSGGDINSSHSGSYVAILRLASQLDGCYTSLSKKNNDSPSPIYIPPLVSIETNRAATLMKEYDAHTVVLRVAGTAAKGDIDTTENYNSNFQEGNNNRLEDDLHPKKGRLP